MTISKTLYKNVIAYHCSIIKFTAFSEGLALPSGITEITFDVKVNGNSILTSADNLFLDESDQKLLASLDYTLYSEDVVEVLVNFDDATEWTTLKAGLIISSITARN